MKKWGSFEEAYDSYTNEHSTYKSVLFRETNVPKYAQLHPMYIMSQFFVDSLIEQGKRRFSIVLPDDKCSIITLVIAKYFQNLQEDPYYASSIFEDIEPGQHVKLGKAVAEFLAIEQDRNIIKYKVGKQTKTCCPIEVTTPIANYHILLEKTESDLSPIKKWDTEEIKIKNRIPVDGISLYLDRFITKRTGVKKTIVVFSQKNTLKEYMANLLVNNESLESVLAYGELNDDSDKAFSVLNKGKLDCIPGISIANKLSQISHCISTAGAETISSIYCSPDKFQEIINNLDAFKKILKAKIPIIIFVPESEFEYYDVIRDLGFVFWQWKPSTLKGISRISNGSEVSKDTIFSRLSQKISRAGYATCRVIRCESNGLLITKSLIQSLFKEIDEEDQFLRHILIMLNKQHKLFSSLCFPVSDGNREFIQNALIGLKQEWESNSERYEEDEITKQIDQLIAFFFDYVSDLQPGKTQSLFQCIEECKGTVCVIVQDDNPFLYNEMIHDAKQYFGENSSFGVVSYSDFLKKANAGLLVDYIIVPWFESDKYIKIKQTYCYRQMIYVLYDFENKWRSAFIRRFDSSFSHAELIQTVKILNISNTTVPEAPFDSVNIEVEKSFPDREEYDFDRTVLRRAVGKSSASSELAESVECVPVILSEETVALWGTGHEVFDVTDICCEGSDKPRKLTADQLSTGHIVLIRQSGKNLIAEKADQLMSEDRCSQLREIASFWVSVLSEYSSGKTIQEVIDALNAVGCSCSSQQVRLWILGETIRPNDINALKSIARIAGNDDLMKSVERVYRAGGEVQEYHRKAGRLLSKALKDRSNDIRAIYNSGTMTGSVDGIGDIHLYRVEEVLNKEYVLRSKINTMEVYA